MAIQEREDRAYREARSDDPAPLPRRVLSFFAALRQLFGAETKRETDSGTWDLHCTVEADELDGGYIAECSEVPGAVAQGETEQEALASLIDAVQEVMAAKMEERFESINFNVVDDSPAGRTVSVRF